MPSRKSFRFEQLGAGWERPGLIAGGGVRAVIEAAGIRDVLAKSLGSSNHANVVKATLSALTSLRPRNEIMKLRGKKVTEPAATTAPVAA